MQVADEKSVFATIQSTYTVPARVRTAGTIVSLNVRQDDYVTRGQIIATVGRPQAGAAEQFLCRAGWCRPRRNCSRPRPITTAPSG
jgi:hypothetical protein